MTADVDLLPCPFCGGTPDFSMTDSENDRGHEYVQARLECCVVLLGAEVAGHTVFRRPDPEWVDGARRLLVEAWNTRANVAHAAAAKDAENEALRAEVERLTRHGERQHVAYQQSYGRAERLAGALRDALECGDDGDWQSARRYIAEALNPTAAQENDDA